jgi:hypothetical protein
MIPRPLPFLAAPRPAGWALLLIAGLTLGVGTTPSRAQGSDSALVARFREASALAVDPTGQLYVADAGRDVVRTFRRDGRELPSLGGPGTRAGEFDGPADLDPTNGQTLLVADAGNGRVQRFSAEGQYLAAIPIGSAPGAQTQQSIFADGRDGADVQGTGRPVAVASSDSDETFVVDGREDVVVTYDRQGRPDRIIEPSRDLRAPGALALDGSRRLYVADRERDRVLAYDLFGTYVGDVSTPELPPIQALSVHRGHLWIVCAERVFVWHPDTGTTRAHAVALDAPLIDAAPHGEAVFLLTETQLLRRERW